MQISDEMLDRADMAFRLSSADRKGALRAALEYALSAISLPVQPVAWRCNKLNVKDGPTDILVWNRATAEFHRDHHDAEITPLYANPVPPTKGPEDDLRMARRAALQAKKQRMGYHSGALWEEYVSGANDKNDDVQSALLALRSRPASALPVVKPLEWNDDCRVFKDGSGERCCDAETVGLTGFYIIWRERDGRHTVSHSHFSVGEGFATLDDAKASAQADYERRILSALTPSVQP